MSAYEKALKSMREIKTATAHLTALGKIRAATEDETLRELIIELYRTLGSAVASKRKGKSLPFPLDQGDAQEIRRLMEYCSRVTASKKPEWQILALRHGWKPPT